MDILLSIITIIILLIIAWQDFKSREIHWLLFLFLVSVLIGEGLFQQSFLHLIRESVLNLTFLFSQGLLLIIYNLIMGKRIKEILNISFGLGDVLMFLTLIFAFGHLNYIIFYILGLVFSLFIWLLLRLLSVEKSDLIPLAGLISLFMAIIMFLEELPLKIDRFNDLSLLIF